VHKRHKEGAMHFKSQAELQVRPMMVAMAMA